MENVYRGKAYLVLGMGVSGRSAASFLLFQGASVSAFDSNLNNLDQNQEIQALKQRGLHFFDADLASTLAQYDGLIVSPGIPLSDPIYCKAQNEDIKIIGEAELACRHIVNPCIGVTGTNGKTTVTLLITHVLNHFGIPAKAVGNIGIPLTSIFNNLTEPSDNSLLVIELSSYQLETLQSKVLDVAVLLNISSDHLEHHGTMNNYVEAKARIFDCIKSTGKCYLSEACYLKWECLQQRSGLDFYDRRIKDRVRTHDEENNLAAYQICQHWGITQEQFDLALTSFVKPPHRIQFVRQFNGVDYIDDSKGTNIDAVIQAVKSLQTSLILIAGGIDKGFSYAPWIEHFIGKVRVICAIGEAAPKMERELSDVIPVKLFGSMEDAVEFASKIAIPGEMVLLSPGCASYDMFIDYAHRGREFQRLVHERCLL